GSYALHGAFWHTGFGRRRSHGCINLAPRDAARVFELTSPAMPEGWTSVYEHEGEVGTVVRVRKGDDPLPDRRRPLGEEEDEDEDDWGDDDPPLGVLPGTDCADDNPFAFPGAAELESTEICAEDADEDGWGDVAPPDGVEAGTDCDDGNPFAFPGAAELESPPGSCMVDADGDGWGDANPGNGLAGGSDCYDGNVDLNPSTMKLSTFMAFEGVNNPTTIMKINPMNAALTASSTLQNAMGSVSTARVSTGTIDAQGAIVVNDLETVELHSVDYVGVCMGPTSTIESLGASYGAEGDVLCGLEFGPDGLLYGIDHDDNLLTLSPTTGQLLSAVAVETENIPLNINACDMAFDCTTGRLLMANGVSNAIYELDPATGVAQKLRDFSEPFANVAWSQVGLEFDPVSHMAYLSVGMTLYRVDVDGPGPLLYVGGFTSMVSNLQNLPICP
ncbi:MAG: L,D-transpeptidase, partial [Myxococcales bacterium]|nr:L,D-transpeptidase [Myxococcales bacterium]